MEDTGEDDGEGSDADARELVGGEGCVAAEWLACAFVGEMVVDVREGEVAKQDSQHEDDGQWQHLLGNLYVEFE